MGGKKSKEEVDEIKALQSELRDARSTIKVLRKRLAKVQNENTLLDNMHSDDEEMVDDGFVAKPDIKDKVCTQCGAPDLSLIVVANRSFTRCGNCKWRTEAKIHVKEDKDV